MKKKYDFVPSVAVTSIRKGYEKDKPEFMEWIRERRFAYPHIDTSGHADAKSLQSIVRHLNPGLLIPIHITVSECLAMLFPPTGRSVVCRTMN